MNRKSIILTTLLIAFVLVGCKIPKEFLDGLTTTPNPLELKGGKIECKVEGTFPAKYFTKKMELSVVPVLKSKTTGAVLRGEPKNYQGEKVKGNNPVISYKKGGKYEQKVSFAYNPDFDRCELYMEATVQYKGKSITFEPVKVADGLIATANMVYVNPSEIGSKLLSDNFQKVIEEREEAEIKFLIQQSNVRSSEAKNLANLTANVKKASEDSNMSVKGIEISSYASPDGGVELNEKLAQARENSTKQYINSQMRKLKDELNISGRFTAQDWDGFKKLMENSDIKDKQLILSVLSMYSDPEEREKEIRNLSAAFTEIKDKILPELRRSKVTLVKEVIGKSDEEIQSLLDKDAKNLTIEEILYGATLSTDNKYKKDAYEKAIAYYPEDIRGYNNLGVTEFKLGNIEAADKNFTKALELDRKNAMANLNKGAVEMAKGNLADAKMYFGNASGAGEDLNQANAAIAIADGDYAKAVSLFGNANTNNAALARILNKDYNAAKATLENIKNPDAKTYYLLSIIAARTNNVSDLVKNVTQTINMDRSYKTRFVNDMEFREFISNAAFSALIK